MPCTISALAALRTNAVRRINTLAPFSIAFVVLITWCTATLTSGLLSRFRTDSLQDDAYIFLRYADHMIQGSGLAWNPDGIPTFGLTSNLYLAVLTPLRLLLPQNPALILLLGSTLSGIIALGIIWALLQVNRDNTATVTRLVLLGVLLEATWAWPTVIAHLTGGMDTPFVIAYLAAYLYIAMRFQRAPSRWRAALLGLWGAAAYLVRPDLLLYTTLIPFAMLVVPQSGVHRKTALGLCVMTAAALVCLCVAAYAYFGTPLPLPFYVKTSNLYGAFIVEKYRTLGAMQLRAFLSAYRIPLLLITAHLGLLCMRRGRRLTPVHVGALIATLLFLAYYRYRVLHIMGGQQRFYYPTLPAIALLTAHSVSGIVAALPPELKSGVRRLSSPMQIAACGAFILGTLFTPARDAVRAAHRSLDHGYAGAFDLWNRYYTGHIPGRDGGPLRQYWAHLEAVAALPDDLVIATTEIGLLSALTPGKTVIDMAGLNTPDFALQPFSAELLFTKYTPDVLYMPHWDYRELHQAIWSYPRFLTDYDTAGARPEGFGLGIALRRNGPHYPALRQHILNAQ